eukprot:CAMPEP_0118900496 /NCGR_PEP_ID=MMETSP1166-20130328/6589_1 /TAXON_ID=1104430 /ORGANISM="Chrysoreinhardia sp, Strain CCMP3193" /LENGTH=229 /DNA_ID=CAMNT_0006839641 /DNA_START=68 /DNA_END=754 /DNA_ORIENTATION=-
MDQEQQCDDRLAAWQARWQASCDARREPSFHLADIHPSLLRFEGSLRRPRVLVPLCGKCNELKYLAERGFDVVGVDGVRRALDGFCRDHDGDATQQQQQRESYVVRFPAGPRETTLRYVVSDFLTIDLGSFDACWDRGAFVAIEPCDRDEYVRVLAKHVTGTLLLVATEHDPFLDGRLGPPYSLTRDDVLRYFGAFFHVDLLQKEDKKDPFFRDRGCTFVFETTYLLTS